MALDFIFSPTFLLALAGGVLPALVWLWFWLKEDKEHPEPRVLLFFTFLGGALAVPLVLHLEAPVPLFFGTYSVSTIIIWAIMEEVLKFGGAYITALRTKAYNEPIDAIIYMLTVALGFSALENTLFIFNPLSSGNIPDSIITGNLRFIGASLLHMVSSATIGIFIAFSFYHSRIYKFFFTILGILFATIFHTSFNLFIMKNSQNYTFITFSAVWISIVLLLLIFEKIKKLKPI